MNSKKTSLPGNANEEISSLIDTLNENVQRLDELTEGKVDVVADRHSWPFLLRHVQERMLHNESAKQAAVLNALQAQIALLDGKGIIILVNEAWRRFGGASVPQGLGCGVGLNYLAICESALGEGSSDALRAAAGIRSVLRGKEKSFSMEYPCHLPAEQRWFLLTVTPSAEGSRDGVIVMHLDVTEQKLGKEASLRFRLAMGATVDAIFLTSRTTMHFVEVNAAACDMLGYTREEFLQIDPWELTAGTLEQTANAYDAIIADHASKELEEIQLRRKDGSLLDVEVRLHANRSGADWIIVSVVRDIAERKRTEEALRTSMEEFRALAEAMPQIVWVTRADGWNIYFNHQWMDYTGLTLKESLGQGWNKPFHPDDQKQAWDAWHQATTGIGTYSIESRLRRADGVYRWWLVRGVPVQDASGNILKWFGTCTDIHDLKTAELEILETNRALRDSESRLKYMNRVYAMLSGINTLIVRVRSRDELFREACRIAVDAGGFLMSLIGIVDRSEMKIVPIVSAGKDEELITAIKSVLSSGALAENTMVARAIREKRSIVSNDSQNDPQVLFGKKYAEAGVRSMIIMPLIVSDEAVGALALYAGEIEFFHEEEMKLLAELTSDIALAIDHIEKGEKLNYLAYYDVLTGLANRSLFLERVAQYMRSAVSGGHKLALLLIDLERFKNINDSLGQAAGDALLRSVADWLTRNFGGANLSARVGSDHFAVVLPNVKHEGDVARLLEKKIESFLNHPFLLKDIIFRVAVKVGVAVFPDDGAGVDVLFKNAEAALKKAKAIGDRYLFYTQKMTATVAGKLTLENQLRQALDKGEFVLHYQPKANLASGRITSAEALIRWNDPRTGLMPPGRFIPILEETGLIYDVGRWALRQAIEDYLRWRSAGLPAVRIAVNVSPLQLRHRDFITEIKQAIGIDAHAAAGLELEITESVIMENVNHSVATLQTIRAMGVTIAIDDFGTGFSSLSYLAKLPVDTLKIDRSFVIDMTAASEGPALVSTIITLAHSLKLKVVAEGVETEEQLSLLRLLNCDEMQGYLFSKPVPSEIFEKRFLAMPPGG